MSTHTAQVKGGRPSAHNGSMNPASLTRRCRGPEFEQMPVCRLTNLLVLKFWIAASASDADATSLAFFSPCFASFAPDEQGIENARSLCRSPGLVDE